MDLLRLRPEREQRTLWIITWVIFFILGIIMWVVLSIAVDFLIYGIVFILWFVVMIPIIVWIPFAHKALEYSVDDEGINMRGGVIWKKHVTVPYSKITNVDVVQGPLQRYYSIGTIHIQTAGSAGKQGEKAELRMSGIRELEEVRSVIVKKLIGSEHPSGIAPGAGNKAVQAEKAPVFTDILKELKEIKDTFEDAKKDLVEAKGELDDGAKSIKETEKELIQEVKSVDDDMKSWVAPTSSVEAATVSKSPPEPETSPIEEKQADQKSNDR